MSSGAGEKAKESTSKDLVVSGHHGHGHGHGHSHDHDHVHPGQAIQYREAPPQFGLASHVDDIIHTEFRYVNGFKPFQFNPPGSCLGPLGSDKHSNTFMIPDTSKPSDQFEWTHELHMGRPRWFVADHIYELIDSANKYVPGLVPIPTGQHPDSAFADELA
ncbi:hypothetical protein H4R27_002304 [Coemansia aciculifera]|nr:hypothetical protein H4R27_002304 [Coemansia aciculifera]